MTAQGEPSLEARVAALRTCRQNEARPWTLCESNAVTAERIVLGTVLRRLGYDIPREVDDGGE